MAPRRSRHGSTRADADRHPLEVGNEILISVLSKELVFRLAPDDEAKKVAFETTTASIPARLSAIIPEIVELEVDDAIGGFCRTVQEQWVFLRDHADLGRIEPSMLEGTAWLETLTTLFKVVDAMVSPSKPNWFQGGYMVHVPLFGIRSTKDMMEEKPIPHEKAALLVPFVEWWGEEVCGKRWGMTEVWGPCDILGMMRGTIMHSIAQRGLAVFIPLALKKGCSVNGNFEDDSEFCPGFFPFMTGHIDVFEMLMDNGLDIMRPYKDGWPLVLRLFSHQTGPLAVLADLLRRRPEIIHATASSKEGCTVNLLAAALMSRNAATVDLVLKAGAAVEYRCILDSEGEAVVEPTLRYALVLGDPKVMKLLITKGKVLEGWKDKYDEAALQNLSRPLAQLAVSAYPSNPRFSGNPECLMKYNPQAMECLEMVLSSGIVCPFDSLGGNPLLCNLYPTDDSGGGTGCSLAERNALALLQRFHGAGFDVVRPCPPSMVATDNGLWLHQIAASEGQPDILDWVLGTLGVHADAVVSTGLGLSPLSITLVFRRLECITLLLKKYKVRAAYPEHPLSEQPVCSFLAALGEYTEAQAEKVLGSMLERSPDMFAVGCFTGVTGEETDADGDRLRWHPLFEMVMRDKPQLLEFLLVKNPPGVAELVNKPARSQDIERGRFICCPPAYMAALLGHWKCLEALLRNTNVWVTDTGGQPRDTIADLMRPTAGRAGGPPRALLALVEARARRERAGAAAAPSAAVEGASASASNAFEDPTHTSRVERAAKKKAKKKGGKKKKGKSKKRAHAGAGSATAAAEDVESEDDSSSDDEDGGEEPDDNLVDSRNAPSLDLMLEQMGLKEKE